MNYYVCADCGHIFREPKLIQESRGEFWGFPCSESVPVCPKCKSDCISDYEGKYEPNDYEDDYDMSEVDKYYDYLQG